MELIPTQLNIDFMRWRYAWITFSIVTSILIVGYWIKLGDSKYGIDFAGGTDVVVSFKEPITIAEIRASLIKGGFDGAVVQAFEGGKKEFSIRVRTLQKSETGKKIMELMQSFPGNSATLLKEDFVGPVVGEQIRQDGLKAFLLALVGILIYISVRFEMRFALGAIVALFHDAAMAAGLYVMYGYEVNAALLAAILTVIGYSVNDTIIVFDRIRENLTLAYRQEGEKKKRKQETGGPELSKMSLAEIMNFSVNQTLSRTILTGTSTLFVAGTLWWFATGAVSELCFALCIGIIAGTYSSIYIASPMVLLFERKPN